MEHVNYSAAIRQQQSIIKRLFSSRRHRSEVIENLTKERYKHLVGRFFRPTRNDKRFNSVMDDTELYICDVTSMSDYIGSADIEIVLHCRYISVGYQGEVDDDHVNEIDICHHSFRFRPDENLDEILEPLYIPTEQAIASIDQKYSCLRRRFLSK